MTSLGSKIQELVGPQDTVLDLGCGIMQHTEELQCKSILGVDGFKPYLDEIKDRFQTLWLDVKKTETFPDHSFDVVILTDIVEHLVHDDAMKLLSEAKRISRKVVVGLTPKEFKENKQEESGAWGLGENILQEHHCVISPEDFNSLKYSVSDFEGAHLFTFKR